MSTDWQDLESQFGSFKPAAPNGTYEAVVDDAEVKETTTGSVYVRIKFKNGSEFSYPHATHWLSLGNEGWTKWHHRNLLITLGVRKEDAEAAIDAAHSKATSTEALVKNYDALYKKAAKKNAKVEIIVRDQLDKDGNQRISDKGYVRQESEFTDPKVFMSNQPTKKDDAPAAEPAVEPEAAEEEEIDMESIPF